MATENFRTSATIGTTGITGSPVISFQSVDDGTLTTGQTFSLGQFVIDSPPGAGTTVYENTPFDLTFTTTAVNGTPPSVNMTPVAVHGLLDATIKGGSILGLVVQWDEDRTAPEGSPSLFPATSPFRTGNYLNYLNLSELVSGLVFDQADGLGNHGDERGPVDVPAGMMVTRVVPEPAPLAIFAALAGFALIRRNNRPKAR